jgi:uncharacterized membrane protein
MLHFVTWISWNLFLAIVPVALAYAMARVGRRAFRQPRLWLWIGPLAALWLIFLPNSCYLFTEPVHLLAAVEKSSLWPRARHDAGAALDLALWTGVSMNYVAFGALSFALAIRPVRALAERSGLAVSRWSWLFFLLMAVGVYLGRIVRYNSWDLLTRPSAVLETTVSLASRPLLLSGIALFGLFLWIAYVVADIWIDGAMLRWQRRFEVREGDQAAAPREYSALRG